MNVDQRYINDVGTEILKAELLEGREWESVALVIEASEGSYSDSGFVYLGEKSEPFDAYSNNPLALRGAVRKLQAKISQESGHTFKKLLVQIESHTGRIKIDFEFDDPTRWAITPKNLKSIRQELRPSF